MKKYIKPATQLTAGVILDSYMITATTSSGGKINGGGSSSGSGALPTKHRGSLYDEEEDPILQLIIERENGNTQDLW